MDEDVQNNDQRRVIIAAIALAAIVAAGLWYFVVIRPANDTLPEDAGLAPDESPVAFATNSAMPPVTTDTTPTPLPSVAPSMEETTPPPSPTPTPTLMPTSPSAPTGVGTWVLAGAFAATLGGLIGLRRPR